MPKFEKQRSPLHRLYRAIVPKRHRECSGDEGAWKHQDWPAREIENYVVSFPKCGRTWLRVMLGAALAEREGNSPADNIRDWLAAERTYINGRPLFFTHALAPRPDETPATMRAFAAYIRDRRRLLLVRDPRDTVVSHYFQWTKRTRGERSDLPESIEDFVENERFGLPRILDFYNLWIDEQPAILSYERMHAEPAASLRHVLDFFDSPPFTDSQLEAAVEAGRFDKMRKMEAQGAADDTKHRLAPGDPSDPESFKVRKGKVGGYRDYFSEELIASVESLIKNRLHPVMAYREPGRAPDLKPLAA